MLTHTFVCPSCNEEMKYNVMHISASLTCPHCDKKYIVVKNRFFLMFELFIFIALFAIGRQAELNVLLLVFIAWFSNLCVDIVFSKLIKWDTYFTLLEKTKQ